MEGQTVGNVCLSVRLSVCFHSIFLTDCPLTRVFVCACVVTIARLVLKVKVIGQGQG